MSEGLSQNKPRIAIITTKGDTQGDICSAVLKEVGVTVCMGMMIIKVLNQKVWWVDLLFLFGAFWLFAFIVTSIQLE